MRAGLSLKEYRSNQKDKQESFYDGVLLVIASFHISMWAKRYYESFTMTRMYIPKTILLSNLNPYGDFLIDCLIILCDEFPKRCISK